MKCKHGGKCVIDIKKGGEVVKSGMSCVIAEEHKYDKLKIISKCENAIAENIEEEALKELLS